MTETPFKERRSGILLHPTSLAGPYGHGDIGSEARCFVDFLRAAKQSVWQMLPVHPIGGGDSPYDSASAFAGGTHLVSFDDLVEDGWLDRRALDQLPRPRNPERADFEYTRHVGPGLFRQAFARFQADGAPHQTHLCERFLDESQAWVWDWALFCAVKHHTQGSPWAQWAPELRSRQADAMRRAHEAYREEIRLETFRQFIFHHQWERLRAYANGAGVQLLGDIPMFVAHDSADVWANQHMFFLDADGHRTVQAGVPPDYFSRDGQLWGNPLYRWDVMQADGYGWWIDRLRRELKKFDAVRLDHFVAFSRYWEVPMHAETARTGRYVDVPGADFLTRARDALGSLPLVAEDLGIVTAEVEHLRDSAGLPGMKILQFAFTPGAEGYLPHRHPELCVAYTGTHDNNTTRGFFEGLLNQAARTDDPDDAVRQNAESAQIQLDRIRAYTGVSRAGDITQGLLRTLLTSRAALTIFPVQDLLDQGAEARMNVPGIATGNWAYRVPRAALTPELAEHLAQLVTVTERG